MKKSYLTALLMLTCVLGVWRSAHAQNADVVVVSVPFEFVVGGATLPAGEYRISRVSPGVSPELAISGHNKGNVFLLPLTFDNGSGNQPTLSFDHVGGRYFLDRIKTLNGVYTLATPREMVMLGQTTTPSPNALSSSGSH
jgi:hypothetical protein